MYDLNVPWPSSDYTTKPTSTQILNLKNVIVTLYNLGYRYIAINFSITESVKIPKEQLNPIPMAALTKELCTGRFPDLKLFSRITIAVNDPSKSQSLLKLQQHFDILAVQPLNEKALQLSITNLDIDLISFNFTNKLPFFLKHKTIGSAIDKGIKFEVSYAHLINSFGSSSGVNANLFKKFFINNVLSLIRTSRSKGIVVSSGALDPVQTRAPSDILTFLISLGLDLHRSKACMTINPERALISGRLRAKSFKQTIVIGNADDEVLINNDVQGVETKLYKKRLNDSSSGRLLKKMRK